MAVNDIYSIVDVQTIHTRGINNIYYFKVTNDDTGVTQPDNAKDMFVNQILPTIRAAQSDELVHDCLIVRRVAPVAEIFNLNLPGLLAGQSLPSSQTVLYTHNSQPFNKPNQGRKFLAGVQESDTKFGRLLESAHITWEAIVGVFNATQTEAGITYDPSHFNRKLGTYEDIKTGRLNPCLSKMRRRIPRRCPTL